MAPGDQNPDLPSEVEEEDISPADVTERLERDPEEQANREDVPEDNRLREENARAEDD